MENDRTEFAGPGTSAKELAAYINEQLGGDWQKTAEYILKLSIADLQVQEQLRDSIKKDSKELPRALQLLVKCTMELGWGFSLAKDQDLNGMIIGNPNYIKKILGYSEENKDNNLNK